MLDRAAFLVLYPEFSEVDTATVDAKLAEASVQIDASVWGAFENAGHGALTAHLLADSPFGNSAKLVAKDGKGPSTVYDRRYMRLARMVAAGIRST